MHADNTFDLKVSYLLQACNFANLWQKNSSGRLKTITPLNDFSWQM